MTSVAALDSSYETALTIVGMAGRFPGARDVREFWQNLASGVRSIRSFSDEELRRAGVAEALLAQPNYVKAGTVIEDVENFDASFFGYTPREAEIMDPQHRLLLECAWEAIEDAAYNLDSYRGRIGMFAGSGPPSYKSNNLYTHADLIGLVGDLQVSIGNDKDALASMISYKLNLKGPSLSVQTFCSTSLVAVHLACQSLLTYECDIALAGGVAIGIPQGRGYVYEEGGILSADGHCRSFDYRAGGSVMGNGVGLVVLKRLAEAVAEGDHIYAVIRGSAVNNDGMVRVGYTAPGVEGQAAVITEALGQAGVGAESISYLEAHGTATALGDAVELAAMKKAFSRTGKKGFCALGTVKPNVGHLDRAAGVTGLIKTALSLQARQLAPQLEFERASEEMELEESPFYVNQELRKWEVSEGEKLRAGVSSFGLGGTNAHVVVEEAPEVRESGGSRGQQLLMISARTETALVAASERLKRYLEAGGEVNLADVGYTLAVGRRSFNHRQMMVCSSVAEAVAELEGMAEGRVLRVEQVRRNRPVVFMFPGVGEQYQGMGRELYESEASFRESVDESCGLLSGKIAAGVKALLLESRSVTPTPIGQPAVFIMEYALAQLWQSWGVKPQALIGYSFGEYVAATLSGVMSLEAALQMVTHRAKNIENQTATTLPARESLELTEGMKLHAPQIPLISNLSGTWITDEQAQDPTYWARRAGEIALFDEGLALLLQNEERVLLEVGCGDRLSSRVLSLQSQRRNTEPKAFSSLKCSGRSELASLLEAMGRLWLAGVDIDWKDYYRNEERRRLSLPTYPFESSRHWVEPKNGRWVFQTSEEVESPSNHKRPDVAEWFYHPAWKQSVSLPQRDVASLLRQKTPLLIFAEPGGLSSLLVESLAHQDCEPIIIVRAGESYAKLSESEYILDPLEPGHYQRLLDGLARPPQTILHLWTMMTEPGLISESEQFKRAQDFGFYSLLYLAQAINKRADMDEIEILAVCSEVHRISGVEDLSPAQATLGGACRVIPQENLNILCRIIDVDRTAIDTPRQLAADLCAELAMGSRDLTVGYRGKQRWVQSYEEVRLEGGADKPGVLREQGVYLITGGMGGVGLLLAEYLAETVRAKVILTGRREFPEAGEWERYLLEHEAEDPVSVKIKRVRGMECAGAEVLILRADVGELEQMVRVRAEIEGRFGELNGVIHAAGTSAERAFAVIDETRAKQCELHFQPKAHGLMVLEEVLEGVELDFCIIFSSLAAVLGGLGFVGYAAANQFMDAYVARHNEQGKGGKWISVNWDTWGLKEDLHGALGGSIAEYEMSPAEGIKAFERILFDSGRTTQIINSTGDLQVRFDQWVRMVSFRRRGDSQNVEGPLHPRPELMTPFIAPRNETEESIAQVWQMLFGLETVGVYDNFLELGGHSLMGTQLVSRLRQMFRVHLPLTILFEAPTISDLAVALELMLIEEIEKTGDEDLLRLA